MQRCRGDLVGAEQLYRQLFLPGSPLENKNSANHGNTAFNLSQVLQARGLLTESRKYLVKALQAYRNRFGTANEKYLKVARARTNLETRLRTCAKCGPVADKDLLMKVCSVCSAARYCGAACQKLHWNAHRPDCRRIKEENDDIAAVAGNDDGAGPSNA